MSVYLYDKAFVDSLREITKDSRINIMSPDDMFSITAITNQDVIKLPTISLQRPNWSIATDRISHPQSRDGITTTYDENIQKFKNVQMIPIRINYLIDVWTKTREDSDNIMRELIWYYITHPTLTVKIPYGLNIEHRFNIFLDPDIDDNSDIVEHKNRGVYFRQTISAYTDDAYLWKGSARFPAYITAEVIINNEL